MQVLGEILAHAVGVAISPIPIVAAIVLLFSPAARLNGALFWAGWTAGIAGVTTVFTVVGPLAGGDEPGPVVGVVKLVVGLAFLVLAWRQWTGRPRSAEDAELPRWLAAVDEFTAVRALGMGVLLSAVNPKNLGLAATAGASVGAADLTTGGTVVVIVVFTVIASASVGLPILASVVAADRTRPLLESAKAWLTANNATVMVVLFVVLGAKLVGDALVVLA